MAGHAAIWIEDWDAAPSASSAALVGAGARGQRGHRADLPARRPGRTSTCAAAAGRRRWRGAVGGGRARGGHRPARAARPRAGRARAASRPGSATRTTAARHVARGLELVGGDATASTCTRALGLLELGLGRIPEAIEALETGRPPRPAARAQLGGRAAARPTSSRPTSAPAGARRPRRGSRGWRTSDGAPARAGRRPRRRAAAGCWPPTPRSARRSTAALALHDGLPMPFERARTLLALGERLRRAKQRAEAREPLTRGAATTFERLGARPWAERARAELRATGGQAGGRRAHGGRRAAHAARAADRACSSRRA